MRNTILITLLTLLLTASAFSAVVRVGDNYTEPEKPRHPYLKNTEIYYMTDEGERKEAEFDLYVLKKPIKEQMACIEAKTKERAADSSCENKKSGHKWVTWYPNYSQWVALPKARLSISKLLSRIDNCTVLPFMFKGLRVEPHIYGRYDELKATAIKNLHQELRALAQLYSIAKVNRCGDYPDLYLSTGNGQAVLERRPPINYLTE